jgi:hypothetical protein
MKRAIVGLVGWAVVLAGTWAYAGVFPWLGRPVNLGQPAGAVGGHTYDDIEGDVSDLNVVYTAEIFNDAVYKVRLTRDAKGQITGASSPYEAQITAPANEFVKAVAVLENNVVYGAAEEYPTPGDTDGGVYRYNFSGTGGTLTSVADLTNVRTGATAQYDPEGIAIDRTKRLLYVMTDDGPNQDVAQYTINADSSLSAAPNWVKTLAAGVTNGRSGSVTASGDLLTVTGSGATSHVWKVTSDGVVTDVFGSALDYFSVNGPRDALLYNDYLYVADEGGTIYAYAWENGGVLSNTVPEASWDLRTMDIDGNGSPNSTLHIGGLGLTSVGELLVGIRADGGEQGRILAFNFPEPSAVALLGLGGLLLVGRAWRKRARRNASPTA